MSDEPDAKKPNTTAEAAADLQTEYPPADLIQYLVIRQDLAYTEQKTADDGTTTSTSTPWPTGAIVAQGAHASVAAIAEGLRIHDVNTIAYTDKKSLDTMRKCVLGAKDVAALEKICAKMEKDDVKFYRWMEQPENVLTAVVSNAKKYVWVWKLVMLNCARLQYFPRQPSITSLPNTLSCAVRMTSSCTFI
ncbi:unnamed protein product, partial [Amoebophrya sp. A120]|eukprot:GSA120T00019325001.1